VVAVLVVAVALLGAAWLWFRDSSLVAVRHVQVTGVSGRDAGRIRRALTASAETMTTLDFSLSDLRMAVAPYPVIKDIQVSTQFPHGMRIRVVEEIPVGAVVVSGQRIAVAGDGTVLHGVAGASLLPAIPLSVEPGGTRLTGAALNAVAVLAAAPYQLLPHISQVTTTASHGLVAQLRSGPSIYFGDAHDLAAKWTAATAVLADPSSAGAFYIDVSDPARPAAGAGTGTGSSGASGVGTTTSNAAAGAAGTTTGNTGGAGSGTTGNTGPGGSATGNTGAGAAAGNTGAGGGPAVTGSTGASTSGPPSGG
jgi:cell division protein FtsQ